MTESVASFPTASVTLTEDAPGEVTLYPSRLIVDREHGPTLYRFDHGRLETITYEVKMGRLLDRRDTGLDSIELAVLSGDATIDAGQLVTTNVRAKITMGRSRFSTIQISTTQDDGNTRIAYLKLDGSV